MARIPEFTDSERWVVESALQERYGKAVETQVADAELRLDPGSEATTACPALYWEANQVGFALFKTGESRFRCMFYYSVHDQYDTGISEYDDLLDCISALLSVQEQHEQHRADAGGQSDGDESFKYVDF